jgi:hypothetical protein
VVDLLGRLDTGHDPQLTTALNAFRASLQLHPAAEDTAS